MAAGRKYHWKHGWIPLDDYARRIKEGKSDSSSGSSAVSYSDLPRASHVTASYNAKHGTFDVQDKQTGARLALSHDHAEEMQRSGRRIMGLDHRSNMRTEPTDGGLPPRAPAGLSKVNRAHYDRELALARTWSDHDLDAAIRNAQKHEHESRRDRYESAYGMTPGAARAIRMAYEAEKKRRTGRR